MWKYILFSALVFTSQVLSKPNTAVDKKPKHGIFETKILEKNNEDHNHNMKEQQFTKEGKTPLL